MSRDSLGVFLLKGIFSMIGMIAVLVTFFTAGPWFETNYWPVLSKLEFVEIQPVNENASRVRVKFTKQRNCEYIGTSWYAMGFNGISDRVPMVPIKDPNDLSPPTLMVGKQYGGPWLLGIPWEEVKAKSYVLVYHKCHSFWTTTTLFYP